MIAASQSCLFFALQALPLGLARSHKGFLIGFSNSTVQGYNLKGKRSFCINLPSPILAMHGLETAQQKIAKCLLVSLANGEATLLFSCIRMSALYLLTCWVCCFRWHLNVCACWQTSACTCICPLKTHRLCYINKPLGNTRHDPSRVHWSTCDCCGCCCCDCCCDCCCCQA